MSATPMTTRDAATNFRLAWKNELGRLTGQKFVLEVHLPKSFGSRRDLGATQRSREMETVDGDRIAKRDMNGFTKRGAVCRGRIILDGLLVSKFAGAVSQPALSRSLWCLLPDSTSDLNGDDHD